VSASAGRNENEFLIKKYYNQYYHNLLIKVSRQSIITGADMDTLPTDVVPALVTAGQRALLNVPYVSQQGKGADFHFNDCGAACASMLIAAYTGDSFPVDTLYFEAAPSGDLDLTADQVAATLSRHGVDTEWKAFLDEGSLYKILSSRKPLMAVILYGPLQDAGISENKTFRGFHYVVVVGIDTASVIFNDPLYTSPAGSQVVAPLETFMKAWRDAGIGGQNAPCGALIPKSPLNDRSPIEPPAPPTGKKFVVLKTAFDNLNIRTGRGTQFEKVGSLPPGTEIMVESIEAGWAKLLGEDHFVSADFIAPVDD
jgi:hypothetical protein